MKKVFHITDMHCAACVLRLEGIEDELDGIRSARASYHKQTLQMEWDESRVSEEQIAAAIREKGYTLHLPAADEK
jgi:copper chaperone CopZ